MSQKQDRSPTGKCQHCGRKLVPFQVKRDWPTRKLHKKCWLEINRHTDRMTWKNAEAIAKMRSDLENIKNVLLSRHRDIEAE